ncbi:hypothetical protein BV22DRAFT_998012, partial [Leucogyrophana mollusca]
WEKLVEDVWDYITTCKAKNKGKGVVKAFSITITDTSSPESADGTGKKPSITAAQAALPPRNKAGLTESECLRKIEQKHHCQEHDKPCYVRTNGIHYEYTFSDLGKWAKLYFDDKATYETPPDELNIHDGHFRQHVAKKNQSKSQPDDPSAPPAWLQQMMAAVAAPMMLNQLQHTMHPWGPNPAAFRSPQTPHQSADQHDLPTPASNRTAPTLSRGDSPPHKRRAETAFADTYPDIDDWLASLDEHATRGRKNANFRQYTNKLVSNGIEELGDLLELSTEKLQDLGGMNFGTANRLLRFARED